MGYYSGVRPSEDRRKPRGLLALPVIDEPHRLVSRGLTVVGFLAGASVALFKAARIMARRP